LDCVHQLLQLVSIDILMEYVAYVEEMGHIHRPNVPKIASNTDACEIDEDGIPRQESQLCAD
jgi:hypothetical protein